ncbi:M16 family metallopeptidase [Argonema galeatum]|uniref:M16 family metallopeptidase n=1 Tax=Argonema galeatum TaxID=2942762 RepID=UPI002012C55F|nr:pitrilysin family protein [Argonema galeatum]MCL1464338.1 insulinase family protein [Argonema galeatum A003/A1]
MNKVNKSISWFLAALLLTVTPPGTTAVSTTATLNVADYIPAFVDYTLSNGLRVVLAKDDTAPVVAVNLWYRVGAANDPPKRSGFAHLFEHIMFGGSANVGKGEFDAYLQAIGGDSNASTNPDYTDYWQILPANQLPLALWLESDRMASLNITQEAFDTERQVVIQEFNERVLNPPYGRTNNLYLTTTPLRGYLPYERPMIGSIEDLNAATLEEAKAFHRKYYIPNNATLVIAGDIDFEQTKALVQAYFGDIPPGEPAVPILKQYPLPAQFPVTKTDRKTGCKIGYQDTIVDPAIELPQVNYSVVVPPRGDRDFYALTLLANILGSGESSRFEQKVIRKGLASSASAEVLENMGASLFVISGTPNEGESLESVQSLLQDQLRKVIAKGVTEAELARAKKMIEIDTISELRGSVWNTTDVFQRFIYQFGSPQALVKDMENLNAVTSTDIQKIAQTYLCEKPMNILITLKTGQEVLATYPGKLVEPIDVPIGVQSLKPRSATPEELAKLPDGAVSRTQPPKPLPAKETKLPPYQTFSLNNGLKAIFIQDREIPKLQISLFIRGSDVAVPANKQGLPQLLADVITQGTINASSTQIAEQVESVGGAMEADAGLEWMTVSADFPSPDSQVAFNSLADVVLKPTFPQSAFDVAKSQMLTNLSESETNPAWLASRQFTRIAYPQHPYGFITSTETLNNLTRNDLIKFHNTFFKPNNSLLVIVGDITLAQAKVETERVFGNWQSGKVPNFLTYPPNRMGDTSSIYLIDRPGAEQATILIGNLGLDARNPESYPLLVANTVLGEGPSGRLFKNLRVDKGYTYSAVSELNDGSNDVGTFFVTTDVGKQYTGDAVLEIIKELKTIRSQPIPEKELAASKGLLLGHFALGLETPANVAYALASYQLIGLPLEDYQNYPQKISQVSQEDVLKAAAKYISSEPIIIVVGDASLVKSQLEKLGKVVVVPALLP